MSVTNAWSVRVTVCGGALRRVRAAGGGVPRGGVPRRRRRRVPPRRLPLLPHPRAAAARAASPLTTPATPPPPHPPPRTAPARAPPYPYRSRLWHTWDRLPSEVVQFKEIRRAGGGRCPATPAARACSSGKSVYIVAGYDSQARSCDCDMNRIRDAGAVWMVYRDRTEIVE